ncbi:MAG: hypothetical protein WAW61_17195 [Methylococcaceae bacterium]
MIKCQEKAFVAKVKTDNCLYEIPFKARRQSIDLWANYHFFSYGRLEDLSDRFIWKRPILFYNEERLHQSLGYTTPDVVYQAGTGGGAKIVDKFGCAWENWDSTIQL